MTSTITTPARRRPKPVNPRQAVAAFLQRAGDTPAGKRVRGLLDELGEIDRDRELASRYVQPGTWPDELDSEERDVWEHIVEALSSANTKEEK